MNNRQKVTSKQVAKLAGVSQTTVSFVLNSVDGANISEETKARVWRAARHLGYVPDVTARALARGRSANLGLVLAQSHKQVFIDEYIPNIITGLSVVARRENYRILVELIEADSPSSAFMDLIRGKEVAGIIISNPTEDCVRQLVECNLEGFPVISLDNRHPLLPSVSVDKLDGVRQALTHLIGMGHRRIACITYAPIDQNTHAFDRLAVFRQTLEQAGLAYFPELIQQGAFDPDTGYAAMQVLLTVRPLPTALFAMNDMMAFGAMAAIHEAGLRVPEDIAVMGFDDARLARFSRPSLSTVREPDIEHGRQAGEQLLQQIARKPTETAHLELKTTMIIRESCGYRQQATLHA